MPKFWEKHQENQSVTKLEASGTSNFMTLTLWSGLQTIDWTCVSDEGFIGHPNGHFLLHLKFQIAEERTFKCKRIKKKS